MALTATATISTRRTVIKRLNMKHPIIISITPDKPNILYSVLQKGEMVAVVKTIGDQVRRKGIAANKAIIYCRYHREDADFYELFKKQFEEHFTSPPGFANIAKYRLVDMYTSVTVDTVKRQIVKSFCDPNGRLRIVICTVAFGMGLDCPNVQQIIHWRPSCDLEGYIQETGRGGRNGDLCLATILFGKGDQQHTAKPMMEYCRNKEGCRRQELFKDFDNAETLSEPKSKCMCCDICACSCVCGHCGEFTSKFYHF